jgi:hypothetical protein
MVIEVEAADIIAVSIRIIPPAQYAGVRDIDREKIAEPVYAIDACPSVVSMPVQAMDGDNTNGKFRRGIAGYGTTYSTTGLVPSATVFKP